MLDGTVIRFDVDRLPSGAIPKPVWLWHSVVDLDAAEVDVLWQAFLRRFDIEHTFRMLKQTLGWNVPKPRDPASADRWTWLLLAAYTQLRLARELTIDIRRPWEKLAALQDLHQHVSVEVFGTSAGKQPVPPAHRKPPAPNPDGHRNQRPAPRYDVHIKTRSNQKPSKSAGPTTPPQRIKTPAQT
ncbi:hypothetical protein [Nocardia beijingensis]|uniref:hypothetical protein n=1 Tax=Nocardia beijingensis TaxID=95162 RepID=UPI002B4B7789|nr:hypothetical protein [Nocardia beijingensis]